MEAIDINIQVEDRAGNVSQLTAPTDLGLSLMEFLKASLLSSKLLFCLLTGLHIILAYRS